MQKPFEYYRPATSAEALQLLSRQDSTARPMIVQPRPIDPRRQGVDAFVDLSLLGFDKVESDPYGTLHLGSLVTLQQLIDSEQLQKCPHKLLAQAASMVATPGIRNLSTLWGAAVAQSGPAEIILALLALEAQVVILGKGNSRHVHDFQDFHANLPGSLGRGKLLREIILPPQGICTGWLERIARTPRDEAIVSAAALLWVEAGAITRACLAVAGVHPTPQRLPEVERLIKGQALTPGLLEEAANLAVDSAKPIPDFRGSAEYRRAMAGVVVKRALAHAWDQATHPGGERSAL